MTNQAIVLYSVDTQTEGNGIKIAGVFTDEQVYNTYLNDMKNAGELTEDEIAAISQYSPIEGETLSYFIDTPPVNPIYGVFTEPVD